MKKIIIILIVLLLIPSAFAASNVVLVSSTITGGSDGKVHATLTFKNTGDAPSPYFLIEIQPRPTTFSVVSSQSVCDNNYPSNVHKTVSGLSAGESVSFNLDAPVSKNGDYNVYGISYDTCCTANPQCKAVQPFLPYGEQFLKKVTVTGLTTTPVCGDGICNVGAESVNNCFADCKGYCGDGICYAQSGESQATCTTDCGFPPQQCGNGFCQPEAGEANWNCPVDCKVAPPVVNNTFPPIIPPGPGLNLGGFVIPIIAIVLIAVGAFLFMKRS